MANVQVYTTNTCAYCVQVKQYLKQKGVEYTEVNVEEEPDRRQELIELSGAMSVPVTVIKDDNDQRTVVRGFNVGQLASAIS